MLADTTRGAALEFLLTLIHERRRKTGTPQLITLSAVVGDLAGLDRWLAARHIDEAGAERLARSFIDPLPDDGSRRILIPLVRRLTGEGKKMIVFRASKSESVACAV